MNNRQMRKQKHKKMAFHLRRYSSHGRVTPRVVTRIDDIQYGIPSMITIVDPKLSRGRTSPNVQCVCVDGELSAILLT